MQFNHRFSKTKLKHLRIHLKQPSPNWLDNTLRSIQCYTKRIEYTKPSTSGFGSTSGSRQSSRTNKDESTGAPGSGFDSFKSKLKSNLQGVKKQTKNQVSEENQVESPFLNFSQGKVVGSSVHFYTEDVRRLDIVTSFM